MTARMPTVSSIAGMIGVAGLIGGGWVKTQFFPVVEGDILSAKLEMPLGAPFEKTDAAVKQIERAAKVLGEKFLDRHGKPVVRHRLATSGTQPFQFGFCLGFAQVLDIIYLTHWCLAPV